MIARSIARAVAALALAATAAVAQSRSYAGGDILIAQPQGDFATYVNAAYGISGHFVQHLDANGIISFRAELGYLNYGSTRYRQPLGGGALGLINVDVTTNHNIMFGGLGLQLATPTGLIRPYATGNIGFSYFFTESSVAGVNNPEEFASSENYSDGGFTTLVGGGFYVPLKGGAEPISLDIGAQLHGNKDIRYLTKDGIRITDSAHPPVLNPVRSAADFVTFRIGVTVGITFNDKNR